MGVIGAILGDIAGSRWEFAPNPQMGPRKTHTYTLFSDYSYPTDDTIMSVACVDACHHHANFSKYYRKYGRMYPEATYGENFRRWIQNTFQGPYNSFGNGSAMRCSYVGQYYPMKKIERFAAKSAACTHNHPEGIRGAVALAKCVRMAEDGNTKRQILDFGCGMYPRTKYPYSCEIPVAEYIDSIRYDVSCQGSVPVAIRCFYETESLEECLYLINSMSIDTDTVGAIAGAICDSFYGTSEKDISIVRQYLGNEELKPLLMILEKYGLLAASHK